MGVRRVRDRCYGLAEVGRQVREMHCHGNGLGGDQSCVGRDIVPDKGKQFGFGIRSCEETNPNKGRWPDRDAMLLSMVQFGGSGCRGSMSNVKSTGSPVRLLRSQPLGTVSISDPGQEAGNSVSVPVLSLSVTLGKRLVIVLTFLLCGSCQSQRHPHSSVPHQTHLPIPLCSLA